MRLQTLKSRVGMLANRAMPIAPMIEPQRLSGRRGVARRLRLWTANPHCAACGCLTSLDADGLLPPFHIDHVVPLFKGGQDDDQNCQVLCVPCHDAKTGDDLRSNCFPR